MSIKENLDKLRSGLPASVSLVAVSKTKPPETVLEAYDAGQRIFGENKVQELVSKQPDLPEDIQWHFVGHVQTNKVKFIAPFVAMIHGVDSLKLLKEINKRAASNNRTIDCLLQFHIATESTKFGLSLREAEEILSVLKDQPLKNVRIVGVMGMATYTDDLAQVRAEFKSLKAIFDTIKKRHFEGEDAFCEISMGMSGDYHIAIEEGSTMIRVGTAIFGPRNY